MRFSKLHGLGNDFVLLDWREGGRAPPSVEQAIALCDRHRGIGADGVLTLLPGEGGTRLVIHNPDGSRPEMCGNGARCAALWVATQGLGVPAPEGATVRLFTDAGVRDCVVQAGSLREGEVEIGMGVPALQGTRPLRVDDAVREAAAVSMGNPHRVLFFDEATPGSMSALASRAGEALCLAEDANIEFVRRQGPQRYEVAVWERGAGLTQACGTGACAVAAAAIAKGDADRALPVEVDLPGGRLVLRLDPASGELKMRGPATHVFSGEWSQG